MYVPVGAEASCSHTSVLPSFTTAKSVSSVTCAHDGRELVSAAEGPSSQIATSEPQFCCLAGAGQVCVSDEVGKECCLAPWAHPVC
jgi:hypothetical protein